MWTPFGIYIDMDTIITLLMLVQRALFLSLPSIARSIYCSWHALMSRAALFSRSKFFCKDAVVLYVGSGMSRYLTSNLMSNSIT
jgi:hypothetical protein